MKLSCDHRCNMNGNDPHAFYICCDKMRIENNSLKDCKEKKKKNTLE